MASLVLTDAFLSVGGTDISSYLTSITLDYSADEVEDTAFGDNTHGFVAGTLKSWSISADFNNDYGVSGLDATLFPLLGTQIAIVIRPASGAKSTTNPEYTGNGILMSYPPIGGAVGALSAGSMQINAATGSDLARATA